MFPSYQKKNLTLIFHCLLQGKWKSLKKSAFLKMQRIFRYLTHCLSSSEHEDEVFVGPIGHKEKCIAVSLEALEATAEEKAPRSVEELTWSPLAGEKFVEIFKEAHLVALRLQSARKAKREDARQLEEHKVENVETFVQKSRSKLKMFEKGIDSEKTPRAAKRETYCVWESPLCQLPPSLQKQSHPLVAVMDNLHSPQMPINVSNPLPVEKFTKIAVVPATQEHCDKKKTKMSQLQPIKMLASRSGRHTTVEQVKISPSEYTWSSNLPC